MKLSRSFLAVAIAVSAIALAVLLWPRQTSVQPIRIGVLHSQTGTMATSEQPLIDAARLAVEEINAAGGLLGRPLEMVVADGKSDDRAFAAEAERLITEEQVSVLFACWTSSCRQAVSPVVERHKHLMFYPMQYEGLEQSPNLFYTGMVPNQQLMPGAHWALEKFGKRVYLLGSDYVYPRLAGRFIRDVVEVNGGKVLAERYRPLGDGDFSDVVAELRRLKPDVVFNNINGDSNLAFFKALKAAGLDSLPVVSFSVAEEQAKAIGSKDFHPNHYAIWNYFQSLKNEQNERFVEAFKSRFGVARMTSSPIEATYSGVRLWALAVQQAGNPAPDNLHSIIGRHSYAGPAGRTSFDYASHHRWNKIFIGKAGADGQFAIVGTSDEEIRPDPFPVYRSGHEWRQLVQETLGRKP